MNEFKKPNYLEFLWKMTKISLKKGDSIPHPRVDLRLTLTALAILGGVGLGVRYAQEHSSSNSPSNESSVQPIKNLDLIDLLDIQNYNWRQIHPGIPFVYAETKNPLDRYSYSSAWQAVLLNSIDSPLTSASQLKDIPNDEMDFIPNLGLGVGNGGILLFEVKAQGPNEGIFVSNNFRDANAQRLVLALQYSELHLRYYDGAKNPPLVFDRTVFMFNPKVSEKHILGGFIFNPEGTEIQFINPKGEISQDKIILPRSFYEPKPWEPFLNFGVYQTRGNARVETLIYLEPSTLQIHNWP